MRCKENLQIISAKAMIRSNTQ